MKITKVKSIHVDEGEYVAMIMSIEEQKGPRGQYLRWTFKLREPLENGEVVDQEIRVTGNTPIAMEEGKALDKWTSAAAGELAIGEEVEMEDLNGRVVRVLVEDREGKDRIYSNVTKVMRAKKKAAPVEAEEVAEEKPVVKAKPVAKPAEEEEEKPVAKVAAKVVKTAAEAEEKPATPKKGGKDLFDFSSKDEEEEAGEDE